MMKGNINPATAKAVGRRRTTGHYDSVASLEDAIAQSITETPDLPWRVLGEQHGVAATTARNIAKRLVREGRIQPFPGSAPYGITLLFEELGRER